VALIYLQHAGSLFRCNVIERGFGDRRRRRRGAAHWVAAAILGCVLAVSAGIAERAWAQAQSPATGSGEEGPAVADLGIAVIDVQWVMRNSSAAKSIQEQIDLRRAAYQSQVSEEERALRDAERLLAEKRAVKDEADYQDDVRAFQARVAEIQRKVQARKRALDEAFAQSMAQLRKEMVSVVAEVSEARGIQMVLFKNQIVIAAKSLDITEEVQRRLDETLPTVVVDLPPME